MSAFKLGETGEQYVANYLTINGNQILSRNWRIREGELDIVAIDQDGLIIFVEVKTRDLLTSIRNAYDREKKLRKRRMKDYSRKS